MLRASLAAVFLLTACSIVAPSPAPAAPTASQQPAVPSATASPQPVMPTPTETAVPSPTATLPPTPTNMSIATAATVARANPGWNAYCRKGPGTFYFAITYLQAGDFYPVVGRDGLDTWWLVQVTPTVQCWEGDPTTSLEGPVEQAPVINAPPLPTAPSVFLNTSHCDSGNKMTVWLTWHPASGNTGYNIYRNGDVIAKVGPNAVSYTDKAPLGVPLKYLLEAFNDYGVSATRGLKVSACV